MGQTLGVLLDGGYHGRGLPLAALARISAQRPARRFRLPGKGELQVGFDADLALVQLGGSTTVRAEDLPQRWPTTNPYLGRTFRGRLAASFLRGVPLWDGGQQSDSVRGRLLRPSG